MAQEDDPRHMTHSLLFHHDSVVIGGACFGDRCSILFVWWWTAGRETAVVTFVWWTVVTCRTCVLRNAGGALVGLRSGEAMSMTMEQVVSQHQQERITLKAHVADQTGLADAVRAINSLATAQVRKDAPSVIDVKGLCLPKGSKKTEAYFAGATTEDVGEVG